MCNIKNESFFTVHGWMRNDLNLKGHELSVFALIYGYVRSTGRAFSGSIAYTAEFVGASKSTVARAMISLCKKGYITKGKSMCNNVKGYGISPKLIANDVKMNTNDVKMTTNDVKMNTNDVNLNTNDVKMTTNDVNLTTSDEDESSVKMTTNDVKMNTNNVKMTTNDVNLTHNNINNNIDNSINNNIEKDKTEAFNEENGLVFVYYKKYFGKLDRVDNIRLRELMRLYDEKLIAECILIAAHSGIKNLSYVNGILRNLGKKGITTIEQYERSKMNDNFTRTDEKNSERPVCQYGTTV